MKEGQILDVMPVGIVVLDRSYQIQQWNRWMEMHSGLDEENVLGTSVFNHYQSLNRPSFLRACKSVFAFGNVVYLSQKLHKYIFPFSLGAASSHDVRYMQQSGAMTPIRNDSGKVERLLITIQDVTDSVLLERRLRQLTQVDSLTGGYNRRFFDSRLAEEFRRHRRFKRPMAVCLMDLDHFKQINDTHGHQTGDRVLRAVADETRSHLREVDMFCRYGGEEFVCLLPETDAEDAVAVAERIREALAELKLPGNDIEISPTASFGVSALTDSTADGPALFAEADRAMYRAKQAGRNRVVLAGRTP